ncbi:hypothetical protein FSARC_405 [Fusarium sarcochroum]|uniref:Uncharacterized protein n=1 Tax=Fusarium sarcochroum TaxID=1208366 RepID=A0A8H4XG70_9HYPO|nr:hypothetical protein FSARC_405 [Fusarium sarcochroum]
MSYNIAAPTTVAASSNNASSYFSNDVHKTQSNETTPVSTPGLEHNIHKAVPVLNREFPKPIDTIDVQALLDRQPGRWSVRGQMEANERRSKLAHNEDELKAQRLRDLEKEKEELRAFYGHYHNGSG